MKEAVVVTEPQFAKAERTFREHGSEFDWVVCPEEEGVLADCLLLHGARIAVVGVQRYQDRLYGALKRNAGGDAAMIARHGVGYDGIDLKRCAELGIMATITPGTLDQSVAEHAIALMLSLVRQIPALDRGMHEGRYEPFATTEVAGKTLGMAGFGKIGRQVARIASQGLGMEVAAFDTLPISEQALLEKCAEQELRRRYGLNWYGTEYADFAPRIDVLSIHLPSTAETREFFNAPRLALLKPSAYLVNTGRGALVDEAALYDALSGGRLAGAALDVFVHEPYVPADAQRDLRRLDNAILTPHVASNTREANFRVQMSILENIRKFLEGRYQEMTRVV